MNAKIKDIVDFIKVFGIKHQHIIKIGALCFAGSISMLTFQYVTQSLFIFMAKGALYDTMATSQVQRGIHVVPNAIQQDITATIFDICKCYKAVSFNSNFKILIAEDIFQNESFRSATKMLISANIPSYDIRSVAQGGILSMEDSNKALDLVLDSFQRNMHKIANFERFAPRSELKNFYLGNVQTIRDPEPVPPTALIKTVVMDPLATQKYWYVYVGVGLATTVILYNVAEPLGQYAVEKVITKYFK